MHGVSFMADGGRLGRNELEVGENADSEETRPPCGSNAAASKLGRRKTWAAVVGQARRSKVPDGSANEK
jgi:hypothetical protein